jgi:hypothetical protein
MRRPKAKGTGGEDLFVGIDLHKHRWHVTGRTLDVTGSAPAFQGTGRLYRVSWLDLPAINYRRSRKPEILVFGYLLKAAAVTTAFFACPSWLVIKSLLPVNGVSCH